MRSRESARKLLKLDLGAGESKKEGFLSVDLYAKADFKVDLMKVPWPWRDESVEEVFSSHFFEHVPGPQRIPFMDELWRILVIGGKATIITPYFSSRRAVQDPTHAWPPLCEQSYLYFNKGWREQNKLQHYLGTADFDFTFAYLCDPETAGRNVESQQFWVKHYVESVSDLQVTLTKRAPEKNVRSTR